MMLSVLTSAVLSINPAMTDVEMLARMMETEARGEGQDGQIAVAWVAINRANQPSWWGGDLLEVLVTPYQFATQNAAASDKAQQLAIAVLMGEHEDPTNGATHFHADYMTPYWAERLTLTAHIGGHKFYK